MTSERQVGQSKIFILGSCVSRDAFALPGHRFSLSGYIARTSLASAFQARPAPREIMACVPRIGSRFQRRMVDTDLRKRAPEILAGTEFDYLLVDLIDERFQLARFGGSNLVPDLFTLSKELANVSGWRGPTVAPGTNQHLAAWKRGVRRLLQQVPPNRIVVNCAFWASRTSDGQRLPNQPLIESANEVLGTMYGFLLRNGVGGAIEYGDGVVADTDHHWGVAPFHYPRETYLQLIEQLDQFVSRERNGSSEACSSQASAEGEASSSNDLHKAPAKFT